MRFRLYPGEILLYPGPGVRFSASSMRMRSSSSGEKRASRGQGGGCSVQGSGFRVMGLGLPQPHGYSKHPSILPPQVPFWGSWGVVQRAVVGKPRTDPSPKYGRMIATCVV